MCSRARSGERAVCGEVGDWAGQERGQRLRQCHYPVPHSQDIDHALEVVGEHSQAHLGADVGQAAREEVTLIHTVFDRSE